MLSEKERGGGIVLMDTAKHLALMAAAAGVALILTSDKKNDAKKKKKSFVKRYGAANKILNSAADKVSLAWLEKDVKAHPEKYIPRDKGIHIEDSEIVEIDLNESKEN